MNLNEQKMVQLLLECAESYGVVSVKAEFEAEGTRTDELLRLADIASKAMLPLTIKIGGCEAIRDLFDARLFGAKYVVAPMVESEYAAGKFVDARNSVYAEEERDDTQFLVNMETITAFRNREAIARTISSPGGIQGIVFGRSDFIGSLGLGRDTYNSQGLLDYALQISETCRVYGLDLVVGGGMDPDSVPLITEIAKVRLDRFETRKVVFGASTALSRDIKVGLALAMEFELLWLQNKREHYATIAREDDDRIADFKARLGRFH